MELGFLISFSLRGMGSGKSILLLWIMVDTMLFRSQELIFEEVQSWEAVLTVANLTVCLIFVKAATPSMAKSYEWLEYFFSWSFRLLYVDSALQNILEVCCNPEFPFI